MPASASPPISTARRSPVAPAPPSTTRSPFSSRRPTRRYVDVTGGFTNSNVPAALEVGFKMSDLFVLKYSDFGADMYGLALVTRKKFADENPQTTRAVVKALNQGTRDTIAAPQKALDLLKSRDPMMKMDIEKVP